MKKTTKKRSYKSAVSIGIAAFASVALLSTGLAAFVLIRNAEQNVDGTIVVAEVVDTEIGLELTSGIVVGGESDLYLSFNAENGDKAGRVQLGGDEKPERLTHTIGGKVSVGTGKTVAGNVKLTYQVDIVNTEKSDPNGDFYSELVAENYLAYNTPAFTLGTPIEVTPGTPTTVDGKESATFEFTFGFAWGSKYASENPSVFYDSNTLRVGGGESGKLGTEFTDQEVETDLLALKTALTGYSFKVTIIAANK